MCWLILGFGVAIRALSYGSDRALWLDEAMLSLNIIQSSFAQLMLKPMLYYQVAPLGFLSVEKALVSSLGHSEAVLRLFPFICSLLGLWLFYRLCQKSRLSASTSLIALAGFATSRGLVYYAGEVKQYASDVLITLGLLLLAYRVLSSPENPKNIWWLGIAGFIAVWFAYPAYFVLLGIGLTLLTFQWKRAHWRGVRETILCLLGWSLSMAAYFAIALESIRASKAHQTIWQDIWDKQLLAFMPPLYTGQGIQWLFSRTLEVLKYPVGSHLPVLAAGLFLAGLLSFGLKISRHSANQEEPEESDRRAHLALLAAPIIITLLASGLHLYPYLGRMVLFLAPCYLLLMAAGIDTVARWARRPALLTPILWLALIVPSLLSPRLYDTRSEEIKPVLTYIQEHQHSRDVLFVHYGSQPAMRYYAGRYRLPDMLGTAYQHYVQGMDHVPSSEETRRYIEKILQTTGSKHSRLWLVLSHWQGDEGKTYLHELARQAHFLGCYRYKGAGAYLYQLSNDTHESHFIAPAAWRLQTGNSATRTSP